LKRPPVGLPAGFDKLPAEQQAAVKNDPLYEKSGTSAGLQIAGGLRLGLHLGLRRGGAVLAWLRWLGPALVPALDPIVARKILDAMPAAARGPPPRPRDSLVVVEPAFA
jgi:hypothetical protein